MQHELNSRNLDFIGICTKYLIDLIETIDVYSNRYNMVVENQCRRYQKLKKCDSSNVSDFEDVKKQSNSHMVRLYQEEVQRVKTISMEAISEIKHSHATQKLKIIHDRDISKLDSNLTAAIDDIYRIWTHRRAKMKDIYKVMKGHAEALCTRKDCTKCKYGTRIASRIQSNVIMEAKMINR